MRLRRKLHQYSPLFVSLVGPTIFITVAEIRPDILPLLGMFLLFGHAVAVVGMMIVLPDRAVRELLSTTWSQSGLMVIPTLLQACCAGLMMFPTSIPHLTQVWVSAYILAIPAVVWLLCVYRQMDARVVSK